MMFKGSHVPQEVILETIRYYYRAVDKFEYVIDYYLSPTRNENEATAFLNKAITQHGLPEKITIDGSHSNYLAVSSMNMKLWLSGLLTFFFITIYKSKYLNNMVE
jgi:putative transposase